MRKIIGIGETILDLIIKNGQPTKANPGGSVFNSMVTLGRLGLNPTFLSEVGNDMVGDLIVSFMKENKINTSNLDRFYDGKSPIAMAFLDDKNNANYQFYIDYPKKRLDLIFPKIEENDIFIFGSIYALRPELREKMVELLEYAKAHKAIIYYDPNFRTPHASEQIRLLPTIIENMEFADIVRGSDEDFQNIFNLHDIAKVYRDKVAYHCPNFICTRGGDGVELFTKTVTTHFDVKPIVPVSTIGAGDNFNAGILFGLIKENVTKEELSTMSEERWGKIVESAIAFSSEVCGSLDNYISNEFAQTYLERLK